ncbi:MAG: hypothetical protein J7K85_03810 [Anaerolineaceae bacterium]|nr:hypothetical protein [Anaerolineaceae bacterium]
MKEKLENNKEIIAILLIVVISCLAFLPFANQTGYFLNDWHPLAGKLTGASPFSMWTHERVGVGLLYQMTYPIIGDWLFGWQLFTLSMRILSTLAFYWLLRIVWPEKRVFALSAALIFAVYPGFMEQSISLTFSNHFISYSACILSVIFTLLAFKSDKIKRLLFLGISLFFQLTYLFSYEYMLGIEVIRFVLLWYYVFGGFDRERIFGQFKQLFPKWLPNLFPLAFFGIWRVFFFTSSRSTTNLGLLLKTYMDNPFLMISRLVLETGRDFFETLISGWGIPFSQGLSVVSYSRLGVILVFGLISGILVFYYLRWQSKKSENEPEKDTQMYRTALLFGLIFSLAMLFPVVMTNREVKFINQMDRYTLHVTVGIALFIAGAIFSFIHSHVRKWIVMLIVVLSVMINISTTLHYAEWWSVQKDFWWQLSWRAPQIKDQTVLMPLLEKGYRSQEDIEVWTPENLIYRTKVEPPTIVAEVINSQTVNNIVDKEVTGRYFRGGIIYYRKFDYALIISAPGNGVCMHVFDSDQPELSSYDDPIIYQVAEYSQIQQIDPFAEPQVMPEHIFGKEPDHGWCYYYQKANLSRQKSDWQEVVRLADEAISQGLNPVDNTEWIVFIEGYINVGRLDDAAVLSEKIQGNPLGIKIFCNSLLNSKISLSQQKQTLYEMLCLTPEE